MLLGTDDRNAPLNGRETGRRGFLTFAAATLTALAVPALVPAAPAQAAPLMSGVRRITLHNVNTNEHFSGVYWADGGYKADALRKLDVLLRDHRAKQVCRFNPKLFDLLARVHQTVDSDEPFRVICGYRSRRTNAMARRRSRGVAKESYHTKGMAIDVMLPDVELSAIAEAARELEIGGVGYYPRSGFVHLDVGPVRSW